MAGAQEADPRSQSKLLFFAPERSDRTILAAYELYLDVLEQSGQFDITIMAPNGSPFAAHARDRDFKMYPVSDFSRKLLQRTPQLWPILTATRRYRYDIALSHEAYACRGLSQIARKVVGVCHNADFKGFSQASKLIVTTSGAAEMAQDMLDESAPIEVLAYPYQTEFSEIKPLPDGDEPLTIGASGYFEEGDGLGAFIHAAQLLHQSSPETRFVIAGDGPMEHELKELSDQIAPFIDFTGPMSAAELADRIDLYCLTAPEASHSVALCQMMDAGVACISTCTHGPMDILKGGMVAPLVPIGDTFLLAVQVQELLEDRAALARIKKACFERIREEDFDQELFAKRLVDLLG